MAGVKRSSTSKSSNHQEMMVETEMMRKYHGNSPLDDAGSDEAPLVIHEEDPDDHTVHHL